MARGVARLAPPVVAGRGAGRPFAAERLRTRRPVDDDRSSIDLYSARIGHHDARENSEES